LVREVALEFKNEGYDPDIKESVMRDTQRVFSKAKARIITADALYEKLRDDTDGEFEVDYVDLKVTKRKIGDVLAAFDIGAGSIDITVEVLQSAGLWRTSRKCGEDTQNKVNRLRRICL
jgi:hypothetical protein